VIADENLLARFDNESSLRLLVVDDEAPILKLLRTFLESRGYVVDTAAG
jgi:CheY-like chemotaxis protein